MNRPANRAGNRPGIRLANQAGIRAGYLAGSPDGTEQLTGQGAGPLTDSPHVRAIASRPVPTCPNPSEPNPGAIPHDRDQILNGNHLLSAVQAEVAREREPVPSRGKRYPAAVMQTARRMSAGGWTAQEIRDYFLRHGIRPAPHWTTIKVWTDEAYAERHAEKRAAHNRSRSAAKTGRLGRPDHTPEFKLSRLRALRETGMSTATVAQLMRFDYGDPISEGQVEYALEVGRYPTRKPRKAAA